MNNSIAKYKPNKSIIYFNNLSSYKHHSVTQINQLFILMICQVISITQFAIQAWDSFKQKQLLKLYMTSSG